MGFCDKCPRYIITYDELYSWPNIPLIHFSVYIYQGIRVKHGIIPNGPTLYKLSEENGDIRNGLIKSPTNGKNKNVTKMSCSIGEFDMVYYRIILNKHSYHKMILCLLGKHDCKKLGKEDPFPWQLCYYDRSWLFWSIEGRIWHGNLVRGIWIQLQTLNKRH